MSAAPKVSGDQIRDALKTWRGNIAAAAHALVISEVNLRKRLVKLGIDINAFRPPRDPAAAPSARRKRPDPIRLRPDQLDRLREAKFDLQALRRQEMTSSDVLGEFFDDAFPAWLQAKAGAKDRAKG